MSNSSQEYITFKAPTVEELVDLLVGYKFEAFIAQGGMGAVYRARQMSLDREVAVKVLPRELGDDENFRKSFQSEAKLMAKLNHPNLIGIYDFGDIDGMLYIIMEFVKGKSLHHSAHGKAIQQNTAVSIVNAVCEGLDHAHQAGILHRDIKPANILLNRKAVPKIGDFGLARPTGLTESGAIYGTPDYSAPEVLNEPEKVDNRTDVFAVGVIFYELLTGKLPADKYVSVTDYVECDSRFDKIIQKAIHPDITKRQDSAQQLADEINEVIKTPASRTKLIVSGGGSSSGIKKLAPSTVKTVSLEKSSSSVAAQHVVPENTKLIRNFVIILLLLAAIYGVLEMKKIKEADVAEKQKVIDAREDKIQKEKEARRAAIVLERRRDAEGRVAQSDGRMRDEPEQVDSADTPPLITEQLNPLEKIARVKEALANGERPMAMMPDTIFKRDLGSRVIMFIDKKMSWDEADVWAMEYGGYIAVCRSKSDLTTFQKEIPEDAGEVWLGAGSSGNKGWCWVDGTLWNDDALKLKPTYDRNFVKLSKYGSASKAKGSKKLSFFIEWRADGSNPSELDQRLLRASDTLTDINPVYPPGTVTLGARNFCIIKSPVTYSEASLLAFAAGGHLIAISNSEEKYQVEGIISKYSKPGDTFWTSAENKNDIWGWQTGEKWTELTWTPSHPSDDKNAVILGGEILSIKDIPANTLADGFIIEWSEDKSRVKISDISELSNSGLGLVSLKKKARILVNEQRASTEKKHASNVKKLWSDLETYLRGLPSNARSAEQIPINKIILAVRGKPRIPKKLAGVGPSDRARDYTSYAVDKQARIEADYQKQIGFLRNGYIKQLQKMKESMDKKGQKSAVNTILNEVNRIGNSNEDFENYFQ